MMGGTSRKRHITPIQVDTATKPVQPKGRVTQILDYLREMQGQCRSTSYLYNSRKSSLLLRTLVTHPSYTFTKILDGAPQPELHYEQNVVYRDNFANALSIGCYSVIPRRFQSLPHPVKCMSYLYVQAPHHKTCQLCSVNSCCQPSMLLLALNRTDKMMTVYHLDAQKGYKNSFVLYHKPSGTAKPSFNWNVPDETAYVSHKQSKTTLYIYIISVFPVAYRGYITLVRKISGSRYINEADVSSDMLILHENRDTVTLYNIHDKISSLCHEMVDSFHIEGTDDLPPPLLSVRQCDNFDLQIGGFPYRLLTRYKDGRYFVKPIAGTNGNSAEAKSPISSMENALGYIMPSHTSAIDEDTVVFDEMESGQIIQRAAHSVRMYKIPVTGSAHEQLQPVYPPVQLNYSPRSSTFTSWTGRVRANRQTNSLEYSNPTILCELDLEDELDLLYTLTCDYYSSPPKLYLNLLDSSTLTLIKSLELDLDTRHLLSSAGDDEYIMDTNTHIAVSGDRDLLIVKWKKGPSQNMALYQLCHRDSPLL